MKKQIEIVIMKTPDKPEVWLINDVPYEVLNETGYRIDGDFELKCRQITLKKKEAKP